MYMTSISNVGSKRARTDFEKAKTVWVMRYKGFKCGEKNERGKGRGRLW